LGFVLPDGMMKAVERVDAFLVGQGGTGLEEGTLEEEWLGHGLGWMGIFFIFRCRSGGRWS
jgi:hypothetical protein